MHDRVGKLPVRYFRTEAREAAAWDHSGGKIQRGLAGSTAKRREQRATAPWRGFRSARSWQIVGEREAALAARPLAFRQYSLASMIVKTLTVCCGSAGFGV